MQQLRNIHANTDRLIVAYYPNGSGGKFLLNCLGLSRHMVLQDSKLARQQLSAQLDPGHKLEILLTRLQQVTDNWCDLDLGCVQLFGDDWSFKHSKVPGFDLRHCRFDPIVHHLSHGNVYFAAVTHDVFALACTLDRWPQARVIRLTNSTRFRERFRNTDHYMKWQQVRGPDWPSRPPVDLDQYVAMPEHVQQELRDFGLETYFTTPLLWACDQDWLDQQEQQHWELVTTDRQCWIWDTDWYVDRDIMIHQLAKLYAWLELDDLDHALVSTFYDAYFSALRRVQQHKQALL